MERVDWQAKLAEKHPWLGELQERVWPVGRAVSFGRLYNQRKPSLVERESDSEALLALIIEHLHYEGLNGTRAALQRETSMAPGKYVDVPTDSRLVALLRLVLRDVEKIWSCAGGGEFLSSEQLDLELEDHLAELGLLDEDMDSLEDNIWTEPVRGNLVFEKRSTGNIRAASFNQLVNKLTSPKAADVTFMKTFLMTYTSFATPTKLLRKLIQRYDVPKDASEKNLTLDGGVEEGAEDDAPFSSDGKVENNKVEGSADGKATDTADQKKSHKHKDSKAGKSKSGGSHHKNRSHKHSNEKKHSGKNTSNKNSQAHSSNGDGEAAERVISDEEAEAAWRARVVMPIQSRVCNVLKQWITDYFDDFNNHKLRHELKAFINKLKRDGSPLYKNLANALAKQLSKDASRDRVTEVTQSEAHSRGRSFTAMKSRATSGAPDPKVPRNIFSPKLQLKHLEEEEIARQLTLIDFPTFANIRPSELLTQGWMHKHLKHRSPNVSALIARFNAVSNWVAQSILRSDNLRVRARTYTRFIKIAEHLRSLNNFQTLMAILAGLNSTPIHRLKLTQAEVDQRYLSRLSEWAQLMKGDSSYRSYRETLASIKPPAIPYVGVFLKDIVYIADGNPDFTPDGLINFTKRKLLYSVISQIQQFQQEAYNLHSVQQIEYLLTSFKVIDDDKLYQMSLQAENR